MNINFKDVHFYFKCYLNFWREENIQMNIFQMLLKLCLRKENIYPKYLLRWGPRQAVEKDKNLQKEIKAALVS